MYHDIELPSAPTFRVQTTAAVADRVTSFYVCHKMIHSTFIWTPYPLRTGDYMLVAISRRSGLIDFYQSYDIARDGENSEGRSSLRLVKDMQKIGREHVIVLFTNGSPGSLEARTANGLPDAVVRCGGSAEVFCDPLMHEDSAYVLIGIPDGEDADSYEACYHDKWSHGTESYIDVNFEMVADPVVGWNILYTSMSEANQAIYRRFTRRMCACLEGSLLTAPMRQRTQVENRLWTRNLTSRLPGYLTLCKMEFTELQGYFTFCCSNETVIWFINSITAPISLVFVILWLGHLLTRVGRKAWYVVLWNYGAFLLVCFGVWTDRITSAFGIHDSIIDATIVYSQPKMRALPKSLTGDGQSKNFFTKTSNDATEDSDSDSIDTDDDTSSDSSAEIARKKKAGDAQEVGWQTQMALKEKAGYTEVAE